MGAVNEEALPCECICQFTREGEVVPLRVCFVNDEGNRDYHKVMGYKRTSKSGSIQTFICKIELYGVIRLVTLTYKIGEQKWIIKSNA